MMTAVFMRSLYHPVVHFEEYEGRGILIAYEK